GDPTEISVAGRRAQDINILGIPDGVTGIQGFKVSQFVGFGFNTVCQLEQKLAALSGGQCTPFREGTRGSCNGAVNVFCLGFGDRSDQGVVMWIEDVDSASVCPIDEFAVYEKFVLIACHEFAPANERL